MHLNNSWLHKHRKRRRQFIGMINHLWNVKIWSKLGWLCSGLSSKFRTWRLFERTKQISDFLFRRYGWQKLRNRKRRAFVVVVGNLLTRRFFTGIELFTFLCAQLWVSARIRFTIYLFCFLWLAVKTGGPRDLPPENFKVAWWSVARDCIQFCSFESK